jgi:hypothetical protein
MPGAAARTSALEQAYRETTYRVFVPGGGAIDLLVGQRCPALDRQLARAGVRDWAFMTACNPASRPLPSWRNAQRQARLLAVLCRGPWSVLPAAGIPAGPDWTAEESWLVLGMPRCRAVRVARLFGQNAILSGRRGGPAQLRWTVDPGSSSEPASLPS